MTYFALDRKQDARLAIALARRVELQIVNDFPNIPHYRSVLGTILVSLAFVERFDRRPKDALKYLDEAKEHLEHALRSNPEHPSYIRRYEKWFVRCVFVVKSESELAASRQISRTNPSFSRKKSAYA